LPVI
jgi:hypothetical protein